MARADRRTLVQKQVKVYSDFMTNFDKNPFTGHVGIVENADAVSQSLKSLFLTNKGERFMNADFGGNLRDMLFEQLDAGSTEALKFDIKELINAYEPRATCQDLVVEAPYGLGGDAVNSARESFGDLNTINIKLVYTVENIQQPQVLNLSVNRVR